jgi:hypothetical protein
MLLVCLDRLVPTLSSDDNSPERLGALELDRAPDVPGIYAWYARLPLSLHDWKPRIHVDTGEDLAVADLLRAITTYSRTHEPAEVALQGRGTYGLDWIGQFHRQSITDEFQDGSNRLTRRIEDTSQEGDARRLLIQLLRNAPPVFASPLYIGVATNLRQRLLAHKEAYENARAQARNDPSVLERLQFEGKSFGERLAGTAIQLEHLDCYVLPVAEMTKGVDPGSSTSGSPRKVAEAAEWVLQRIFHPAMGRK